MSEDNYFSGMWNLNKKEFKNTVSNTRMPRTFSDFDVYKSYI